MTLPQISDMDSNAKLSFADERVDLSVRSFDIADRLSETFTADVVAVSTDAELDLARIVGQGASIRLAVGTSDDEIVVYSGVCSHAEQVAVESEGVSTYQLRIVPMLWRCTQRSGYRIFQQKTAIEIVSDLLAEWDLKAENEIDPESQSKHAYRVQFGESDFDFMSRMLADAGVSFAFRQRLRKADESLDALELILTDHPQRAPRKNEVIVPFVGHTEDEMGNAPYVTKVRFRHDVRPGRVVLKGHDFRASPDLKLSAEARGEDRSEARLEHYDYEPPSFQRMDRQGAGDDQRTTDAARKRAAEARRLARRARRGQGDGNEEDSQDDTPNPRDQGDDQLDSEYGSQRAKQRLAALRTGQRRLTMLTNDLRLRPGAVFTMRGHPRKRLSHRHGLLVVSRRLQGEAGKSWQSELMCTLTADPYVPPQKATKPRVNGVQSAVVVGPRAGDVHTDSHGRVKVRFHWDRDSDRGAETSCWLRVSQAWAGNGYGLMALPRVGHEVLVDFFDGDPDRPVVVGRVHHASASSPAVLPEERHKTVWRSRSMHGGIGFNEISFDDALGQERLYMRAERNLTRLIQADEENTIGANLVTHIGEDETREVEGDQSIKVGGDSKTESDGNYSLESSGLSLKGGAKIGIHCEAGKLIISNGTASIVLDGPHIHMDAAANVRVAAGRGLELHGKQVEIDADPDVLINTGTAMAPNPVQLPASAGPAGAGRALGAPGRGESTGRDGEGRQDPEGTEAARLEALRKRRARAELPERVRLPESTERQLREHRSLSDRLGYVSGELLDPDMYKDLDKRIQRRVQAEEDRLQTLGTDLHEILDSGRDRAEGVADRLETRLELEKDHLGRLNRELDAIFDGKRGNFFSSVKALGKAVGAQVRRIASLRKDLLAMIARERQYFTRMFKTGARKVNAFLGHFKHIIKHPGSLVLDIVMSGDKQLAEDMVAIAELFGKGDALSKFFGLGGAAGAGAAGAIRPPDHQGGSHQGGHGNGYHGKPGRLDTTMGRDIPEGPDGDVDPNGLPNGPHPADPGIDPNQPGNPAPGDRVAGLQPGSEHPLQTPSSAVTPDDAAVLPPDAAVGGSKGGTDMVPIIAGVGGGVGAAAIGGGVAALMAGESNPFTSQVSELGQAGELGQAQAELGQAQAELGEAGQQLSDGERQLPDAETSQDGSSDSNEETDSPPNDVATSRDGGLAPEDVVTTVSYDSLGFLQSPVEGQMMVVPTTDAVMPSPAAVEQAMVSAQMNGEPVEGAIAQTLSEHGFGVYHRSSDDALGGVLQLIQQY